MTEGIAGYNNLNIKKEVVVSSDDLPLHCPMNESAAWCSHPRVFLPIESSKTKSSRCPYCGTVYRLGDKTA